MPAAPSRPALRQRYDRRQDAVVTQAAKIFARDGYNETTMAELAATMDLAAGALYHYFGSKEHLLAAICDQIMEPLLTCARELRGEADHDPEERLGALLHLWVAHVCAHRDHMLVFQQERHLIESGDRWRRVRTSRKEFERLVAEDLSAACGHGAAPHDELRLRALLGMVNHTAQWYRPRGGLEPRQIADGYLDLVLGKVI